MNRCYFLGLLLLLVGRAVYAAPISKWGELKSPPGSALPGVRVSHTAIYDPIRNTMVVYGGVARFSSGGYEVLDLKGDVWTQSFGKKSQWTERITNGGPAPRYAHSAIHDAARDRMIIFGGMGEGGIHLKDVWALSLSDFTWSPVTAADTAPFQRVNHSAIYDEARDRMIVFGGIHGGDNQTGDTFLFFSDVWTLQFGDTNTWQEIHPSNSPGFKMSHLAAYVAASDWMVVAGGFGLGGRFIGDNGSTNEVWALTLGSNPEWINLAPNDDGPEAPHGLTDAGGFDPVRNRIVSFGECCPNSSSVWSFSLDTRTWEDLSPHNAGPSPRSLPSGIMDPILGRMWIFGGREGHLTYLNDTWSLKWGETESPGRGVLSPAENLPALTPVSLQVVPNPLNSQTRISYVLTTQQWVSISVYDLQGRKVATLQDDSQDAGEHFVSWKPAEDQPSGIYFVSLSRKEGALVQRVLFIQ